jgi:hypothetical protein
MNKKIKVLSVLQVTVCFFFVLSSSGAQGATVQQSVTLKGGWNAVFLEVQPPDPDPAVVFAGVPDLLSVWAWNPRTSPVEYIQNPDLMVPEEPYMMAYFPGQPLITNLHAIYGEIAYLIHRDGGAGDHIWNISGEPTIPYIEWKADSFNFVGFHLEQGSEPLFFDFFSASPSHDGQEIYVLDNATSSWVQVISPSDQMKQGEAFWVYCRGHSQFTGPLAVQLEISTGLVFGKKLLEQNVHLLNHSDSEKPVTVTVSTADPQLHYYVFDPAIPIRDWIDMFSQPPSAYSVAAGGSENLLLGVLRAGIPPDQVRTANLEVTDGDMRILLPVSVTGVSYAGLWVGEATIRMVSQPHSVDPLTLKDTGSEFSIRLIVHLDDGGQARLLREVVQLWNEDTSSYVLVANESRLGEFTPGALRDGQPVGRRISTAAFGFSGPVDMIGQFALCPEPCSDSLGATVGLPWDDPTNPFRHQYHPDHRLVEQSYNVLRSIGLSFVAHGRDGNPIPGAPILSWGSTDVGGIYTETITLQKEDFDPLPYEVHIEGTFLLHKVSSIGQLEF